MGEKDLVRWRDDADIGYMTSSSEASPPGRRILIYGNSGSGKTTMARHLVERDGLGWLSLDDIAWTMEGELPVRRPLTSCGREMRAFMDAHESWVMDGCYGEMIGFALPWCTELRFLNPGVDACLGNCRARPWEPDKYPDPGAQEAMLETLIDWVKQYGERDDDCSLRQHRRLFESFSGAKREYRALVEYDL